MEETSCAKYECPEIADGKHAWIKTADTNKVNPRQRVCSECGCYKYHFDTAHFDTADVRKGGNKRKNRQRTVKARRSRRRKSKSSRRRRS